MSQTAFDASGFLRFDLETGLISSAVDESLTLLPRRMLGLLAPGGELREAARDWGRAHGERLAEAARESREPAPIEALADHLGGVLAVAGLGRVTIETRGDALLFGAEPPVDRRGAVHDLFSGFLAGFLSALDPAGFEVLPLPRGDDRQLYWAGSPRAVARVRGWLREGMEPLAAIDRLSPGGAP